MREETPSDHVAYPSGPRQVDAEIASPGTGGPWPAVIVIHDINGPSEHFRDIGRRLAREGYLAMAPDLYSNDGVFKSLDPHDVHQVGRVRHAADLEAALRQFPAERQAGIRRAVYWDRERDTTTYVPDLMAAAEYLRARPDTPTGAVGAVGFCWGGGVLGQLLVAGAELAAAVIYYGEQPPLAEVHRIRCRVQAHYGTADTVVGCQWLPDLAAAMKAQGKSFTFYIYDHAPHAFFDDTGPRYREEAARLAWERTLLFFQQQLTGATVGAR